MIRLVIADIDGTLVENNHISEQTLKTIQQLRSDGITFTVATGRHFTASIPIIERLGVQEPVICSNGAYLGLPSKNQVIQEICINQDIVKDAIDLISQNGSDFLLYTTKRIVATKQAKEKLESRIGSIPAFVIGFEEIMDYILEGVVKILIIETDDIKFEKLYNHFQENNDISIVSSNKNFLDIGSRYSSKGNALLQLCKYYNISSNEVLAIGDQENDRSMLEAAGVGVAMGNASAKLKEFAKYHTDTIDNEGFAKAVTKFVFEENGDKTC